MAVYDCFIFCNELDLLELRLKTLDPVVDYFVLAEAPWTFSGKPKPLYYHEHQSRFSAWKDKIKPLVVGGLSKLGDPWRREFRSRDWIKFGFMHAGADDWIFSSDVDEIWRPELRDAEPEAYLATYEMLHCYYWLNGKREPEHKWKGTRRSRMKHWQGGQATRFNVGCVIPNGGWHFSFLGDAQAARDKLKAYAHTEYSGEDYADKARLQRLMDQGLDIINPTARYVPIPIDSSFPKPLLEDFARWEHLTRPAPQPA